MTGAPRRLLAWFAVMATLLTGCTPAASSDASGTNQSVAASPAAVDVDPAPRQTIALPRRQRLPPLLHRPPRLPLPWSLKRSP